MDNLEITVFDEIKDYKEKIYFLNFRQWIFTILIIGIVVPIYIFLKSKIGEEATSYIVIVIAGIFGFFGFVKIHELPAEKIMPYWFRHYFTFRKSIQYMTDKEYEMQNQKKSKKIKKEKEKDLKGKIKEEKLLEKARKKYGIKKENSEKNKIVKKRNKSKQNKKQRKKDISENNELIEKLSKLSEEQRDALSKLLGR